MSASRDSALSTTDITVEFEDYTPVRGISVRIDEGKTVAVMGRSGSGKSTFIKAAAGIIPASSGSVSIFGKTLGPLNNRDLLRLRKTCGFVFQDAALWQNMSVYRNLELPLEQHYPQLSRSERERKIRRAIEQIRFTDDLNLRPASLSAGEAKLVAFVRAILTEPRLLILDEPTTFVDRTGVDRVLNLLRNLKEAGTTLVVVSHNATVVSQLADEIVVIEEGKLLVHGEPEDVASSDDPRVRDIVSDVLNQAATFDTDILSLLGEIDDEL
ncbi:MAG: ABC transporter ATP-binding protein [Spirochaetaceae bacterium]